MRRWLRWNVRCRRGRRCARVSGSRLAFDFSPSGVWAEYTCARCGTRYRGGVGSWRKTLA